MRELQEYDRTPFVQVREIIIDQLKLNFAHDNLIETEFEIRLEKANAAATKQELLVLVEDLPRLSDDGAQSTALTSSSVALNSGQVQEMGSMFSILGGTTRKGLWRPARNTQAVSVLGGIDLDYTEAEMPPGVTELNVFCLLGGVEIKVPPGINVEVHALPILGGVDNKSEQSGSSEDPVLRVRAITILGGVDIKTKKAKRKKR